MSTVHSDTSTRPAEPLAPHRALTGFYDKPEERAEYVNRLFDESAPSYDGLCRLLSLGSDRFYRKWALRRTGLRAGTRLLDVATGTGLVVQAAIDVGVLPADIVGVDPSRGMLQENRKKHSVCLIQGRGERLPLGDEQFDFITMGYALRHVADLHSLFREFRRVLKPEGKVLIMEISRPKSQVLFKLLELFMGRMVPALGRLVSSKPETRRLLEYYWATIAECVPPETILKALSDAGLKHVERKSWGGVINDYQATR